MALADLLYWGKDLVTYEARDRGFYRVNPLAKLAFFVAVLVMSLWYGNPVYNVALLALILWIACASDVRVFREFALLKWYFVFYFLFFLLLFTYTGTFHVRAQNLSHAFPTVPFPPFTWHLSLGALLWGASRTLAYMNVILVGLVLLKTTSTRSIMDTIEGIGLPYSVAFLTAVAFRYMPTIFDSLIITVNAQRARGLEIDRTGPRHVIRSVRAIATPLLLIILKNSNDLVIAVRTRGIDVERGAGKTRFHRFRLAPADYGLIAASLSYLLIGGYLIVARERGTLRELASWFA